MNLHAPGRADALAAQYVLGTLRGRARARFERLARSDPVLAEAVRQWEERLMPLAQELPPVAPPTRVWQAILKRTHAGTRGAREAKRRPSIWMNLSLWRGLALAGLASAFVLAVALFTPAPERPEGTLVVVLAAQDAKPALVASADRTGRVLTVKALAPVELAAGRLVRPAQVAEHPGHAEQVAAPAGRELARDPALVRVDVGLVDRAPQPDELAQLLGHPAHERQPRVSRARRRPPAAPAEPGGRGEVVERDHRCHALRPQLAQHLPVVLDLGAVEVALGGLHPGPLDRQPVRVVVQPAQLGEVLPEPPVLVAGRVGAVAGQDATALLELPPVAVVVAALDLVRRRGAAPQEPVREAPLLGHGVRAGRTAAWPAGARPSSRPAAPRS